MKLRPRILQELFTVSPDTYGFIIKPDTLSLAHFQQLLYLVKDTGNLKPVSETLCVRLVETPWTGFSTIARQHVRNIHTWGNLFKAVHLLACFLEETGGNPQGEHEQKLHSNTSCEGLATGQMVSMN